MPHVIYSFRCSSKHRRCCKIQKETHIKTISTFYICPDVFITAPLLLTALSTHILLKEEWKCDSFKTTYQSHTWSHISLHSQFGMILFTVVFFFYCWSAFIYIYWIFSQSESSTFLLANTAEIIIVAFLLSCTGKLVAIGIYVLCIRNWKVKYKGKIKEHYFTINNEKNGQIFLLWKPILVPVFW